MAGPPSASAQTPLRPLGRLELEVLGVSAAVDPVAPTVPKNIASAVRIVVRAGALELSAAEVERFLGPGYGVRGELSGPGLPQTVTLPAAGPGEPGAGDPLLLPLPPLAIAGVYRLSNIRVVDANGNALLDAVPGSIPIDVINQILVTSVKTRALTLDEIRAKGIVLDSDDFLGFEFTLGLKLESEAVNLSFPVVFDREGVVVPQALTPPPPPPRGLVGPPPMIVPLLLEAVTPDDEDGPGEKIPLTLPGSSEPIRIPSVLVIPGNVGFLKQFFSAQLFVANGAPVGSGLVVRDITGTVRLPPGADFDPGTEDDPLALPEVLRDGQVIVQPETLPVRGLGPDGAPDTGDDTDVFDPGDQGQAEFLIRGELEGFHTLDFDIAATLDGLPVGPVQISGRASGGVLVRNPFFDMTFTVPAVIRKDEEFSVFVTVTNIGEGAGNEVTVALDGSRLSGASPIGDQTMLIEELLPGDARTLEYRFVGDRTGQVVASYLKFDSGAGASGQLNFSLAVGERGVPLSPDTLVLPTAVDALPPGVVDAAMRVLGQAWSVANAAAGTLPSDVQRITTNVVVEKALALAEAGLRVRLGSPLNAAFRDLVFDFHGGEPPDPGFDALLRETNAGRALAAALGAALASDAEGGDALALAGGLLAFEREVASLAASGPDVLTLAVGCDNCADTLGVTLVDGLGRSTAAGGAAGVIGGVLVPLEASPSPRVLGLVSDPAASPYTLELAGSGDLELSVSFPRGDGTLARGSLAGVALGPGASARLVVDPSRPDLLELELDGNGDGVFEQRTPLALETIAPAGPRLVAAAVIGPETLSGASPFGLQTAVLFDRIVDAVSAEKAGSYALPNNVARAAKRQLSGRLVFVALEQPEGPHFPVTLAVSGIADARGAVGPAGQVPLASLLVDPGAVVTGRVLNAQGDPVTSGSVTYAFTRDWVTCQGVRVENSGLARFDLREGGRFEFRYVRQDPCGGPFKLFTTDPNSGARREVSRFVRADGERIVLDIVLLGRGNVAGTVRDLSDATVPGAAVTVLSETDEQSGGTAVTDGNGRYEVFGITVGPVSVRVAKGTAAGRSSGRIDRAGTTGIVDVVLDGGAVDFSGRVLKLENGDTTAVPGAGVTYAIGAGIFFAPVGYVESGPDGSFAFTGMPVGEYRVSAAINTRDKGQLEGVGSAGDVFTGQNLVIVIPDPSEFGTVNGVVTLPGGARAVGAIVSIGQAGAVTNDNGEFELRGVSVRPGQSQTVSATSADGLRRGSASVLISTAGEVVSTSIELSGLGSASFTVLDAQEQPVVGQEVRLLTGCADICGCSPRTTDINGTVTFGGLGIGTYTAHAIRSGAGAVDVAKGAATVPGDGGTGFTTMKFRGTGLVTGIVVDADDQPVHGADVALRSLVFVNDGINLCGLVSRVSHQAATGTDGEFRFTGVNVGAVSLTASQTFFPTPVGAQGSLTRAGEERRFELRLVDTIAGELSGVVYLPDGVTPAGAGVEVTANGVLPDVTVSTDAAGRYQFAKIFPQGSYLVTIRDPVTGGLAQERLFLRAEEPVQHDFRLKGRGTVRVTVVDGADVPVPRAFVTLRETQFPSRSFDGSVDPSNQGVLEFRSVFEGPISVEASDPFARGGRVSATVPGPGTTLDVRVRLTTTGTVTGRFLLPDRTTRIPFGTVRLLSNGSVIGQVTTPGTGDEAGTFRFDFVPAGAVRVEAEDPLTGRTGIAVGTLVAEGQTLELDVVAQGIGTVTGQVLGSAGPEPLALVDIVSGSYKACTFSDSQGVYLISGVPEGLVSVTASLAGGFLKGTASGTLAGDGQTLQLNVPLRASASVSGQVVQAGGLAPAPISLVTIRTGGTGGATLQASTDEQGAFRFERVPAGPATLEARVLGSIDVGSLALDVPDGGNLTGASIELRGVGALHGLTLTDAGAPVAALVQIRGDGYSFSFVTGSDGAYRLPEVLAGPVTATLSANIDGFALHGTAAGAVVPGLDEELNISIQPTASIAGRVLRAGSSPQPAFGAQVTLRLRGSFAQLSVQAQEDGGFAVDGIPLGTIDVTVADSITGGVARVLGVELTQDGQLADIGDVVLDVTPVAVVSVDPPDGSIGIAIDRPVVVTLSDPIASTRGIAVKNGATLLGGALSLSPDGLSVTITRAWPDSALLTVEVSTELRDVFGRAPGQPFTSSFRTVDLSPPQVTGVTPPAGAIQVSGSAPVTVSFDEDISATPSLSALVTLTGAGPVGGDVVLADAQTAVFTPLTALSNDTLYTVTVNGAVDASGNVQSQPFSSSFATIDTLAPVLGVSQPQPAGWVKSARPTISGTIQELLSGVDPATGGLLLDEVARSAAFTPTNFVYTPDFDLAEGQHDVEVAVADRAGNSASLSFGFGVDTVPPEPALVTGVEDGAVVRDSLTLGGIAADTGSGLAAVELFRDGLRILTLVVPDLTATLSIASWSEGEHLLTAGAIDVAGNQGATGAALRVVVDNDPLQVEITSPEPGRSFRDDVSVSAQTSEPAARVDFSVGGQSASDAEPPYQALLPLDGLAEGDALVTAQAVGLLGETASATIAIRVDRTPPAAPDAARITAEQIDADLSVVLGDAGAAEPGALLEVENPAAAAFATAVVEENGAFGVNVRAVRDDVLSLVAVDEAGNRSAATEVVVEQTRSEEGIPLLGLEMWLSADRDAVADAEGRVSSWTDRSERGNDLHQPLPGRQPLLVENEANGLPVLRFDGTDDHLLFTTRLEETIQTVFWVIRESADATADFDGLLGDSSTFNFLGNTTAIWHGSASALVREGQTWIDGLPVDGTATPRPKTLSVISLITTGPVSADNFSADRGNLARSWHGDLAELIVYDRPLSGEERQAVEDFLVAKYRPFTPAVGAPRAEPNGGEFAGSQIVTLSTPTAGAAIHFTTDGSEPTDQSAPYTGPFALTETTTLRARAFRAGSDPSPITTATFTETGTFSPARVPDLLLWAHAGAGLPPSRAVDRWADQSGNANDLVQANGARQPLLVRDEANGFPVLRFDGVDDHLLFTQPLETIRTVFWVVREAADATANFRGLLGHASSFNFLGNTAAIWHGSASADVRGGQTWIDGLPVDGTVTPRPTTLSVISLITTGPVAADNFSADRGNLSRSWDGDLAELIVYQRALSGDERQAVEDFLVAKYRPFAPTVSAPRVEPNGGEFTGSQLVTLSTPTPGAAIHYTTGGGEPTELSTPYAGPFTLTETTKLRARAFLAGFDPSPTTTATFTEIGTTFSPSRVEGLRLWVHAGAGLPPSLAVDRWADQSGDGNDLVQANGAHQPLLVRDEASGFPVLRFDGVDDHLRFTQPLVGTIRTVFWVVREAVDATANFRGLLGDSTTFHFFGNTNAIWHGSANALVREGQTWIDGVPVDGALTPRPQALSVISLITTGGVNADNFSADRGNLSRSWDGDLAELIVYDRPLSGEERQAVEEYLTRRYGVAVPPASAPSAQPNGGVFSGSQQVTLVTTTPGAEIRFTTDGTEPTPGSTLYQAPFAMAETTTVRARAFRSDLAPSDTATFTFFRDDAFTPLALGGLRLWVRADAGLERDGPRVTGWRDQSGQAVPNDLTQDRGVWLPGWTPDAAGGLPALRLDGLEDRLDLPEPLTTIRTVFWVLREDPAAPPNFRAPLGDPSTFDFLGSTTTLWGNASTNVRNGQTFLNGLPIDGVTATRPQAMSILSLVTTADTRASNLANDRNVVGRSWFGEVAELIVYDRALTSAERIQVEDYLNARYGIFLR